MNKRKIFCRIPTIVDSQKIIGAFVDFCHRKIALVYVSNQEHYMKNKLN